MEKTIITIVTRMEEKLGSVEAKLDSMKTDNDKQHDQITRRLDIANGRVAKIEQKDDEMFKRIESLEYADKKFIADIEETNIIPITRWFTSNRHFVKVLIGFILTMGAVLSVVHFFIEDIFKLND